MSVRVTDPSMTSPTPRMRGSLHVGSRQPKAVLPLHSALEALCLSCHIPSVLPRRDEAAHNLLRSDPQSPLITPAQSQMKRLSVYRGHIVYTVCSL